jgi:signal transduction histidine kinase
MSRESTVLRGAQAADARALVHELQVHQIELEMQNEDLQRAQAAAQEASEEYYDLFDFAPVGYFVWDHDGRILEVNLAGAIMQLQTYAHLKNEKPKKAAKVFDAGMTLLHQVHSEARRLISGVRPPILDAEGIVAAISHLVNEYIGQASSTIDFRSSIKFSRLVPILENAIYRIVQEALANACKHSQSKRIQVELAQLEDNVRIKIQDWGVGFKPGEVEEDRFGLAGIRERARMLGGTINVESAPGQGACLTVELPLVLKE